MAPIKDSDINSDFIIIIFIKNIEKIRIIPYLPSLSKMAAKTIDPATGASTWALGNQRCVEYKGIFTMKAIHNINQIGVVITGLKNGIVIWNNINIELFHLAIKIMIIKRGNEAETVYIIRYVLACTRSGWAPHPKIIIKVGIREASKKI